MMNVRVADGTAMNVAVASWWRDRRQQHDHQSSSGSDGGGGGGGGLSESSESTDASRGRMPLPPEASSIASVVGQHHHADCIWHEAGVPCNPTC
jgi:hypothetical protein